MSLENLTWRAIDRTGQNFDVEGESRQAKGILEDDKITFGPTAAIRPGLLLQDQHTKWTYIISDVNKTPACLTAAILRFGYRCCIYRNTDGDLDAFGRSYGPPSAIASGIPVAFLSTEKAALPVDSDVRPGDILAVPEIGERYLVRGIQTASPPGLCIASLVKQSANVTAAALS